jgi:alpha-L-glutamate ligase-like protein
MWGLAGRLEAAGVLGLNRRNATYTLIHNKRRLYPLVDDKLLTKGLAQKAGAAVPELYGVIETQRDVKGLAAIVEGHDDFVVKPSRGSGGEGIVVVAERTRGAFRTSSGTTMDAGQLAFHVSNILSGIYSLGGQPDKALIEYRVQFDPVFEAITFRGVPDIRIVVFLGVPVMAMVRLPTRASDGKANLHRGAIGTGVDIATGKTLTAVWRNSVVAEHPDTGSPVAGVAIPGWPALLDLAARSYEMTGLGYQGIDIVLDRALGPLILELNARPGLNIQIANRAGLRTRLEAVEAHRADLATAADRVAFAVENFAAENFAAAR